MGERGVNLYISKVDQVKQARDRRHVEKVSLASNMCVWGPNYQPVYLHVIISLLQDGIRHAFL